MTRIHVFTIAAANYLPKVRVLFQSLRRWRPEWRLHLAISDVTPPEAALRAVGADEIHMLDELDIPHWRRWTFCHTRIELATAIKPFVLKRLLARPDCKAAMFFDPDVVVFSPLTELAEAFEHADIVLTPHMTSPERDIEDVIANEICTAQHGVYNLGFIGVASRPEGRRLADWWAERTYRFCREDFQNGIYTDQRWIDFVPAFFDRVRVLRAPNLNVAPWNLSGRRLRGSLREGIEVDGIPLGFYHFSQVDSAANDPATASQPTAIDLVAWYRREIVPLQDELPASAPWGYGFFSDGTPIGAEQRVVYRLRDNLQKAYPDPFAAGAGSYSAWWKAEGRRNYPALFDPSSRAAELRRLMTALIYGRTGDQIAAEFQTERGDTPVPWLDEENPRRPARTVAQMFLRALRIS